MLCWTKSFQTKPLFFDVPPGILRAFDIVSMPPSSLVANARCSGDHYAISAGIGLPVGLRYTVPVSG